MNNNTLLKSLLIAFVSILIMFFLVQISNTFIFGLSFMTCLYLVIDIGLYISFNHDIKCNGTELVDGCNKYIKQYSLKQSLFVLISVFMKSSTKHYHGIEKKNGKYQHLYCCDKCKEKHEAVRIADILTRDYVDEDSYTLVHGHHQ